MLIPTTPIARVPPEILEEIFNFLFIGTLVIPSFNFATLWSVSQTCSQWRSVVLRLRYIWNDVIVGAPTQPRECRPILHLANHCLFRSRGTPVSIRFYECDLWDFYGGALLAEFLTTHATMLQRLSLTASVDLSQLVTPILEDLDITSKGPRTADWISLIERSGCTILRLKVYRALSSLGCHRLLKATPSLEELETNGVLPLTSIQEIFCGNIGGALRLIHCPVTPRMFGGFVDMLTSHTLNRPFSRAVKLSLDFDFHLDARGAKKLQVLRDRGIEIRVTEPIKRPREADTDWSEGGYDSDKVCSLIFK